MKHTSQTINATSADEASVLGFNYTTRPSSCVKCELPPDLQVLDRLLERCSMPKAFTFLNHPHSANSTHTLVFSLVEVDRTLAATGSDFTAVESAQLAEVNSLLRAV